MKKHAKTLHGHIQNFKKKHGVGYTTLGLLALLAVETNLLGAYNILSAVS